MEKAMYNVHVFHNKKPNVDGARETRRTFFVWVSSITRRKVRSDRVQEGMKSSLREARFYSTLNDGTRWIHVLDVVGISELRSGHLDLPRLHLPCIGQPDTAANIPLLSGLLAHCACLLRGHG